MLIIIKVNNNTRMNEVNVVIFIINVNFNQSEHKDLTLLLGLKRSNNKNFQVS